MIHLPVRCHQCGNLPQWEEDESLPKKPNLTIKHIYCECSVNTGSLATTSTGNALRIPLAPLDFLIYGYLGKNILAKDHYHLLDPFMHYLTYPVAATIAKGASQLVGLMMVYIGKMLEMDPTCSAERIANKLKCSTAQLEALATLDVTAFPTGTDYSQLLGFGPKKNHPEDDAQKRLLKLLGKDTMVSMSQTKQVTPVTSLPLVPEPSLKQPMKVDEQPQPLVVTVPVEKEPQRLTIRAGVSKTTSSVGNEPITYKLQPKKKPGGRGGTSGSPKPQKPTNTWSPKRL